MAVTRRWSKQKIASTPDFPHGTTQGYGRGCKCIACRRAHSRYAKGRQLANMRGGVPHGLVPAGPTHEALDVLLQTFAPPGIAHALGISNSAVHRLLRRDSDRVERVTERGMLALTPEAIREAMLDRHKIRSTRAAQRIHSLQALGYGGPWLAARLGNPGQTSVPFLARKQEWITRGMERKVDALADEVADTWATTETCGQSEQAIIRVRNHARRSGWLVPGAYDADGKVIPGAALIDTETLWLEIGRRRLEVARLHGEEGLSQVEIAARLRVSTDIVRLDLKRGLGRLHLRALDAAKSA